MEGPCAPKCRTALGLHLQQGNRSHFAVVQSREYFVLREITEPRRGTEDGTCKSP